MKNDASYFVLFFSFFPFSPNKLYILFGFCRSFLKCTIAVIIFIGYLDIFSLFSLGDIFSFKLTDSDTEKYLSV